jgi:putative ABC transport system ATP-binding protein
MDNNLIECISLTKKFITRNQTVTAVDDVNFSVGKDELVLIKGRSGAGKSTLINLMCGLIKPTSGKVLIDGQCISELPDKHVSRLLMQKIGIIFQNFNLLPTYTIYENIEMAVVPGVAGRRDARGNIPALLDQFGLRDKAFLLPSELSSGQQQKVAIVRCLVKQPEIILADEPTGSVDDETAAEIMEHLLAVKMEKKLTLVIATHGNISENIADNVFILDGGRVKDSSPIS